MCALAVFGSRLASSGCDGTIEVWAMMAAPWTVERTLLDGANFRSDCLAGWQGKVLSGDSRSVQVWDAGTGARDATFADGIR